MKGGCDNSKLPYGRDIQLNRITERLNMCRGNCDVCVGKSICLRSYERCCDAAEKRKLTPEDYKKTLNVWEDIQRLNQGRSR